MIKIAICDDEAAIVEQIEQIIRKTAKNLIGAMEIQTFYSGTTLINGMEKEQFDMVFLDIQMHGLSGVETAKKIRQSDEDVVLIYVSGYDEYFYDLFRVGAFDFVRKPINPQILKKTFLEACERVNAKSIFFHYKLHGQVKKVRLNDIMWFQSYRHQLEIHLKNGEVDLFYEKLNDLAEKLKEGKTPFLRIHQSYLVNYYQIATRHSDHVTLYNGVELPVSAENREWVGDVFNRLLGGEID